MPFAIEQKLVVAVASSALFDLGEADRVFRECGEEAYREYQREHENDVLAPGVAFPFIKRLLSFNRPEGDSPVEVILLSRNDPDTGLRVFNSIEAHGLDITRAAFPQRQRTISVHSWLQRQHIPVRQRHQCGGSNHGWISRRSRAGQRDERRLR